jgi:hypothetical protein
MASVVTHARFQLDKIDAETLASMGVEVLHDFPSDDDLGLENTKSGEKVVGTLTEEEFSLYVDMIETSTQIQNIGKAISARKMREIADQMEKDGDIMKVATEAVQHARDHMFESDEAEAQFFRLQSRMSLMSATFYWIMNEKYDCHGFKSGVRTKRRFVTKGKRTLNG